MPDIFVSEEKEKEKKEKKPAPRQPSRKTKKEKVKKQKAKREKLPSHTHNPLTSYNYYPEGVHFETQEREEEIVLLLRSHLVTNVKWVAITILMIFAPIVLSFFPLIDFLPGNFQLIAVLMWYLVTTAFALENFLTWFFSVFIVTDERVVDIDFYNLLYKEVSDANIDKIQDVTYKMGGAVRTVFNYGDVLIQTAGEMPNFEFLAVPKPDNVAKVLQDLRIEEEVEKIEGRVR